MAFYNFLLTIRGRFSAVISDDDIVKISDFLVSEQRLPGSRGSLNAGSYKGSG